MNLILLALFISLPAFLAGVGMLALQPGKSLIRLLLGFSGAFLLTITLLHILPEVYGHNGASAGIWVLLGFAIQILLDTFSRGVEHGHLHLSEHGAPKKRVVGLMVVGLCLHAFIEGLPLSQTKTFPDPLAMGIMLHSIPVAAAFTALLFMEKFRKSHVLLLLGLFILMAPLGMATGYVFEASGFHAFHDIALALTVGIFLHLSTTILFESGDHHQYKIRRVAAILLGMAFGLFTVWISH
jgi:zinc and cadmium transporter